MKRKTFTKTALSISILLILVWVILGATSTLAWFTDTSQKAVNTFVIGDVSVELYHRVDQGNGHFVYEQVDETTKIFDDEALYEPGYTQTVYMKIKNAGNVDFDYRFSVILDNWVDGKTETGAVIHLPQYLKFGVVFGSNEAELMQQIADRHGARNIAANPLNSFAQHRHQLAPDAEEFAAIVVYMPEVVGNEANYRGTQVPRVDLGVNVTASQTGTIEQIP